MPAVHPGAPEICDGLDDDCNGQIDENVANIGEPCSTGNPGICGPGTLHCAGGVLLCFSNTGPKTEVCNRLDDDCNGVVEEAVDGARGATLNCLDNCPELPKPSPLDTDHDGTGQV